MRNPIPFLEYFLRPFPGFTLAQPILEALALRQWERNQVPPPPRSVKAALIRHFVTPRRRTFVETGTFYGDLLAMLSGDFDELHSIELSPRLARRARRRFAKQPHIFIHQGDSGAHLGPVLAQLRRPAVLWLDGHYSGLLTARGTTDSPLALELDAILRYGTAEDMILIDDARLLGVHPAYPAVDELMTKVRAIRSGWDAHVEADVVQIGPGA